MIVLKPAFHPPKRCQQASVAGTLDRLQWGQRTLWHKGLRKFSFQTHVSLQTEALKLDHPSGSQIHVFGVEHLKQQVT